MRALILTLLLASPAAAGDAASGETLFGFHCAGCHGADGAGGGSIAQMLSTPMPDLTTLAARNGGVFPVTEVADRIDGTVNLDAHGGPMPIFGFILEGAPEALVVDGGEIIVPGAIADIIAWLETVQAEDL